MSLLDPSIHTHATFTTGVSLDGSVCVDDVEFVGLGGYREVGTGYDADEGEECASGSPAFQSSAGVVVGDVAFDLDRTWLDGQWH